MTDTTKKIPAPRLRFKQFEGSGEWEEKTLEEVCERISQGGTPDTSELSYWGGSVAWLTPAEMGKRHSRFIDKTQRNLSELGLKNCSSELLPIGSVIISTRAPIGYLAINSVPMAINQGCKGLVMSNSNADFVYYSLLFAKNKLSDLGAGNTFKELTGKALKAFAIPLPPLPEQIQVAAALSSLDAVIQANTDQLAALRQHKQGLMQQLFPAEGEKVPRVRFPEFEESGEWEEKKLGEVAVLVNSKVNTLEIAPQDYVSTENILQDFAGVERTNKKPENGSVTQFKNGDVLVSNIRPYLKKVWAAEWSGGASNDVLVLRAAKNLTSEYLVHLLKNEEFISYMMQGAKGLKMPRGDIQKIKIYPVPLPPFPEQQRIAAALSSLDNLITAQGEKIGALKEFKRGLMQGLFPAATATPEGQTE